MRWSKTQEGAMSSLRLKYSERKRASQTSRMIAVFFEKQGRFPPSGEALFD